MPPDEDHQRLVSHLIAISDFCESSPWLENVCMVFVARHCPNMVCFRRKAFLKLDTGLTRSLSLKWCIILLCLRNCNYEISVA